MRTMGSHGMVAQRGGRLRSDAEEGPPVVLVSRPIGAGSYYVGALARG